MRVCVCVCVCVSGGKDYLLSHRLFVSMMAVVKFCICCCCCCYYCCWCCCYFCCCCAVGGGGLVAGVSVSMRHRANELSCIAQSKSSGVGVFLYVFD